MCLNPSSFPEPSQGGEGSLLPLTPLANLNSPAGICRRVLSASSSVLEEETSTVGAPGWVLQGAGCSLCPPAHPAALRAGKLRHNRLCCSATPR